MDQETEKWLEKWDAAQAKGIFKDAPKPPQRDESDFFGSWLHAKNDNTDIKDVDAKYWDSVYRLSNHQGDSPDPLGTQEEILNEETEEIWEKPQNKKLRGTPEKSALGNAGEELSNTANPVEPPSRGIDQRKKVTPDWSDGLKIRELTDMKYQLYTLECKLNMNPKFGSYGKDAPQIKSIQGQIDDLKDRIDKLSNSISPDFIEDESS